MAWDTSMTTSLRWLIVAALSASTAGCSGIALTDVQYPVYGNPVNPTPAPGYRVECSTVHGVDFLLLPGAFSACRQIIVPAEVVVTARG